MVLNGEILACKKVKQACERHKRDLKRQGTDAFPWVFDEEKGHRPIEYIERFCRPSQGNYEKIIVQPWQHFIVGSLYGWVHRETGLRRYREGLIFVAKKQGKSTLASGLSLYGVSKDNENGARVYLLANSMRQARLIYDECRAMVKQSPILKKHFRSLRDAIYYDATLSKIEPQATDSEKLDGLNSHLAIFDEIHEYDKYTLINVIKGSTASRDQPLMLFFTTAGYQLDGPLMDYYGIATDILNGVIDNERVFYYLAELDEEDDVEDTTNWIKANPNMGVTVKLEDMIEEWEQAKLIPAERTNFITKRLNRFVDAGEQAWLSWDIIKRNDKVIDLAELRGRPCVGGFDLSDTEDFTSACLEFPLDDGMVAVISHSWIPEAKVLLEQENIPYREYADMDLLTIVPGEYVQKEYVYDWYVSMSKHYMIELITYDPNKAFGLVEALKAYGFSTQVVRQGGQTLGPAVDDLRERFIDGKIIYNKNRLFRWYLNNVRMIEDRGRNKIPAKTGRYRKIDGFAAFLNAHTEVMKKLVVPKVEGGVSFISINDLRG